MFFSLINRVLRTRTHRLRQLCDWQINYFPDQKFTSFIFIAVTFLFISTCTLYFTNFVMNKVKMTWAHSFCNNIKRICMRERKISQKTESYCALVFLSVFASLPCSDVKLCSNYEFSSQPNDFFFSNYSFTTLHWNDNALIIKEAFQIQILMMKLLHMLSLREFYLFFIWKNT